MPKVPSDSWRSNFVSAYAASHPWEDFAETWAHYLHIIDSMEMAGAFGLQMKNGCGQSDLMGLVSGTVIPSCAWRGLSGICASMAVANRDDEFSQ